MSRSSYRQLLLTVAGITALALLLLPLITHAFEPNGVTVAWQRARAAGAYHFESDVTQVTAPVASIANVGRRASEERLRLEGSSNLRDQKLEMTLWTRGGSVLEQETGVSVRVEQGKTAIRQGTGPWKDVDDITGTIAPDGDFMGYLRAVRDVESHAPETRAGITFTRHTFQIDGPTFALYMRDQIEATMRADGSLPNGASMDVPRYYMEMTGDGELWVANNGLPIRQMLHLQFPENKGERLSADITVHFSHFGQPAVGWLDGSSVGRVFTDMATNPAPALSLSFWLGIAVLLVRYHRSRRLQRVIPLVVVVALILMPLLTGLQMSGFFAVQTAKAAAQDEQQQTSQMERTIKTEQAKQFDPHVDPLVAARNESVQQAQAASTTNSTTAIVSAIAASTTANDATDSDSDGLTNWAEEQLGTDPSGNDIDGDKIPDGKDTDGDTIPDGAEVKGFIFDGKLWYMNARDADTNKDGIADTREYDADRNGTGPDDTDADKTPDVFDNDNDDDGVPDAQDLAPFKFMRAGVSEYLSDTKPFSLTIQNLNPSYPTFVDFQIRPREANHLWYAHNVLDWPEDRQAQIQDGDNKTFADIAGAGANREPSDGWGDMKLVPMLEIRMKNTPSSPSNLPDANTLKTYNITVNNLKADGTEKVAYVPLSMITDEQTGARVAFNGRMVYQAGANWGEIHAVRMVWAVQALVDVCQDSKNGVCITYEKMNVPQVVQMYPEEWTLTGLNVREDRGSKVAVVYEDPAVDTVATAATVPEADTTGAGLKDDRNAWALANGLDNSFLSGRDADKNGTRDLTLSDIKTRFDRGNITDVNDARRWSTPDIFQVEEKSYPTLDEAVMTTAMTETKAILKNNFNSRWSNSDSDPIMPLLLYAREDRYRALSLDVDVSSSGYVTKNGSRLTLNMKPGNGTDAEISVDTNAGLSWSAYCAPQAQGVTTPSWETCDQTAYWNKLEQRHKPTPTDSSPEAQDVADGEMVLAQLYYLSMAQGMNNVVQIEIPSVKLMSLPNVQTDADSAQTTKKAFKFGKMGVVALVNQVVLAKYINEIPVKKFLGHMVQKIKTGVVEGATTLSNMIRDLFRKSKILGSLAVAGVVVAIGAIAVGLGYLIKYYLAGDPAVQLATKIVVQTLVVGLAVFLSAVKPIMATIEAVKGLISLGYSITTSLKTVATSASSVVGTARTAGAIGAVIGIAITWGFFIYSVVSSGVDPFSPEFNSMLAETIAATIYLILLTVLSASVIGLIIVGIIAVIDAILTAICELGVDELRKTPGLDGACFTLGTAAIKGIAKLIYAYDPMIDLERKEMVATGAIDVALQDPNKGYITGNPLAVTLPVTTTVTHKDPSDETSIHILNQLWMYSQANLKSSTFKYSTTRNAEDISVGRSEMTEKWNVSRDHVLWGKQQLYRGQATSDHTNLTGLTLPAGLNKPLEFYLNMGYAVPAVECWGLAPLASVCYERTLDGKNSSKIDTLQFDIFPNTIDDFMKKVDAGNGAKRLDWDSSFPALRDADGDGLTNSAFAGIDSDDSSWDGDDDGLSDKFELERRAAGVSFSPILPDTDGDHLFDAQEMQFGTSPYIRDTDNDGLEDGEEVYHQEYASSNGDVAATSTWSGGWDVTIASATGKVVTRVSSDPTQRDADGDGVGDKAERSLANQGYHPTVWNNNPIQITVSTDDADGIVKPGQSVQYRTTVTRDSSVDMGKGVLEVHKPTLFGTDLPLYKLDLDTQTAVETTTTLQVPSNAGTQQVTVESAAQAQRPDKSGSPWAWDHTTQGSVGDGTTQTRFVNASANRPDRPDSYLLSTMTSLSSDRKGTGDVRLDAVPSGTNRTLDQDNFNTTFLRGDSAADVACADNDRCMTVWDHYDNCNTVTLDYLYTKWRSSDPGGAELVLFFIADNNDRSPKDGGYEGIWYGGQNGVADNNKREIDVTRTFCGSGRIELFEADNVSKVYDPTDSEWDTDMDKVGEYVLESSASFTTGEKQFYRDMPDDTGVLEAMINIIVPSKQVHDVVSTITGSDTSVVKSQFSMTTDGVFEEFHPVVATDGTNFLVVWEWIESAGSAGGVSLWKSWLLARLYDSNGNTISDEWWGDPLPFSTSGHYGYKSYSGLDVAWIGGRYRIAHKHISASAIRIVDIDQAGRFLGAAEVATNAGTGDDVQLAYNPAMDQTLLVYKDNVNNGEGFLRGILFAGAATSGTQHQLSPHWYSRDGRVAFHAQTGGWLISWVPGATFNYRLLRADLAPLLSGLEDIRSLHFSTLAAVTFDSTLACPAPRSLPVMTLPFEELPGVTQWNDSTGNGNHATSTAGATSPGAGVTGAPDAPVSNYAVWYDGTNDYATVPRTISDDFSIAFWFKSSQVAGDETNWWKGMGLVDGDVAGNANDFGVSLGKGKVLFGVGGANGSETTIKTSKSLADGKWHHIVATRKRADGAMKLYVDGLMTPDATGTGNTSTLTSPSDLRLGGIRSGGNHFHGSLDQLSFYQSALAPDAVKSLYDRGTQAYCLAAAPGDTPGADPFAQLKLNQVDLRGGPITAVPASAGLKIDDDKPTAEVTSFTAGTYIQGLLSGAQQTVIIGGTADDETSGVFKAEVSINNSAYAVAEGAATWTYEVKGGEGVYRIAARATDAAGNVGDPSASRHLIIDATAPNITLSATPAKLRPRHIHTGEWVVDLTGTIGDPKVGPENGSGIDTSSFQILMEAPGGTGQGKGWQTVPMTSNWAFAYRLADGLEEPTGEFKIKVRAKDKVGNERIVERTIELDGTAPRGSFDAPSAAREVITDTLSLTGLITETGSAGLDAAKTQLQFVPIEQVVAKDQAVLQLALDGLASDEQYPDTSLNRNDASCTTLTDCPDFDANGRFNEARSFNGTSIANVSHDATIDFDDDESFTLQTWIKASSSNPLNANAKFLVKRGATSSTQWYTLQLQNGAGSAALELPGLAMAGGPDLRDNAWHHVVGVVDRQQQKARLYLDGKQVNEQPFTGKVSNTGPLEIGGWNAASNQRFIGAIDQVAVWSRALLPTEIAALYDAPNVVTQAVAVGAPVTSAEGSVAAWRASIPANLEGQYQIDLQATDALGNRAVTPNIWRGVIDTSAPRVDTKVELTGAEYFDTTTQTQRYGLKITCAAQDLHLKVADFTCPGAATTPAARSFAADPSLERLFPDWTHLNGLTASYTTWSDTPTPTVATSACDIFGHCAPTGTKPGVTTTGTASTTKTNILNTATTDSTTAERSAMTTNSTTLAATTSGKPLAVVSNPTNDSVVASDDRTLTVEVNAEATTDGASLKVVTLSLFTNNAWKEVWRSDPNGAKTNVHENVQLTNLDEGTYQLVAQATDTSDVAADTFPVNVTVDQAAPTVTLTQQVLDVDDTYQVGSGIMRLSGTVSDSIGIAAVQLQVNGGTWEDVTIENGTWRTAVPLGDASEGKNFTFDVRAIDRAGRIGQIKKNLLVDITTTTPPDTTITDNPLMNDPQTSATFTFTSQAGTNSVAGFQCRLDDEAFVPCVSPRKHTELADGEHRFEVRAVDSKGFVDRDPAAFSWSIDTKAPETSIIVKPASLVNEKGVSFTFAATDIGSGLAGFECKLDAGAFVACGETQTYSALSDGSHTLEVRAVDNATNRDATPESYTWSVDTASPDTTITTKPNTVVNVKTATFGFSGSDTGGSGVARFECTLDGGDWATCQSGVSYSGLTDGQHSFMVRAVDKATNPDAEPEAFTWVVDTTPPNTTIIGQPPASTPEGKAKFTFTGDDGTGSGVAGFECKLDADSWKPCDTGTQSYDGLSSGSHTFIVRAYDQATNRDQSPASYTWAVLKPTALQVPAVSGTYGDLVTLSATLTSGNSGVGGKIISFALNGTAMCGVSGKPNCPTTNASGVATLSNVSLGSITAGTHSAGVAATFERDGEYDASSATGRLTINQATLTVTADNQSRTYGASEPQLTVSYTGFKNGETSSGLTGAPSCTTTATATSPVSPPTYPITCTVGSLQSPNYTFSFVAGGLTITPATLTITADNQTKQYSDPLPPFTVSYAGLQNGESSASLSGTVSCTTTATPSSAPGTYPITCNGQTATNYKLVYQPGTLTVTKETVKATYTGDTAVLTAGPTVSTAAVRLSANLAQEDAYPGALTLAKIRFEIFKFSNNGPTPDVVIGNVPVDASGNAVTTVNLAAGDPWTVRVMVESGNTHWTTSTVEVVVINVALGTTEKRVTGGGWIADNQSASGKSNFGFTVTPQKSGSPKGNSAYVFRGTDGFTYLVKSTSWQGGGLTFYTDPAMAAFSGKAVVQKINAATGAVVESWGNYSFMVDLVDGDQLSSKSTDRYTITILDTTGKVWRQIGTRSDPIALGGGSVTVKSK